MLIPYDKRLIFCAKEPVDIRMSIDGLSRLIQAKTGRYIHDGSIYVFYNKTRDKVKCLFWDGNGFVIYYKRLDQCQFRIMHLLNDVTKITSGDLDTLLSGFEPVNQQKFRVLEHRE